MMYPEKYQNNTRITPERAHLLMIAMFTHLFEGATFNEVDIYYNNIQEKISNSPYSYLY
jgi:hypothetical protein